MILALLGTQKQPFERFVKEVTRLLDYELIYLQTGYNNYMTEAPPGMGIFNFHPQDKIDQLYEEADFIITHGGTGSIMHGLYKHKKILAIPRLKEFNEHVDDHQLEICKKFAEKGYIKYLSKDDDIVEVYKSMLKFEPVEFKSEDKIYNIITDFITGKKVPKK